ncbi:nucleotide sugar dehydrogenase [Methylocystis parvus]|uniref:UDP-glucose 6-dehydrogenase n=1 Tax=Methylocystis parvus TaxID=134 RepID=A0A6B8MEY3_9HYPH|nr:nucleotide sugar dehydrogenase [Methylocystis parvus]QGM99230.1 nucleotide sugar dehydrogenase [Methylocystis parvus]WBK00389.1 nucleotide sugar dehydrogenase [Methylocystis parvus OBBP]
MKISIFGLGYVGLTAAACITEQGHTVYGFDVSEAKVAQISAGLSPIKEPGVEEIIGRATKNGLLRVWSAVEDRVSECDMAIVCVGTPSGPDGAHNMSDIAEVSRQIAASIHAKIREAPLTVVYRSTFRPGTIEELIAPIFRSILGEDHLAVELVYNPEFLREAVAVHDYFHPPKIVVGTFDGGPNVRMDELHKGIEAPVFYTRYREAEFTKFVDNSFHALKVAYANEIGRACAHLGISAGAVHEIFVSDTKLNISPCYTRPGGPFGGSCLPKDVRALQYISSDVGAQMHVVDSLIRSNDAHKHFIFQQATKGLAPGSKVLMIGLAFKADSDDLRESPNVDLARKMLQAGFSLTVYDPSLRPGQLVGQNLGYAYSQLPSLSELLKPREFIEDNEFDVVVDANGAAASLNLKAKRLFKMHALA